MLLKEVKVSDKFYQEHWDFNDAFEDFQLGTTKSNDIENRKLITQWIHRKYLRTRKPSAKNHFVVTENTLMWAFRYALGRKTGAVSDVVDTLKMNWSKLSHNTQEQIKQEIGIAISLEKAGMDCDIKEWESILNL